MAAEFAQNLKRMGIEFSRGLSNVLSFKIESKNELVYHITVAFTGAAICSIQISEASFIIGKIPKFIFIYTIAENNSTFQIASNNSFLFDINSLTISDVNPERKFRNLITHITGSFYSFICDIRNNYKNYLGDPNGWIEEHYSIKRNSYHTCWNICKDNSFINIDRNEYFQRVGELPENFAPFKVLVIGIENDLVKIIALKEKSHKGKLFKLFSVVKSKSIEFHVVLTEIASHFFMGGSMKTLSEMEKINSFNKNTSGRRPGHDEAIWNSSFKELID